MLVRTYDGKLIELSRDKYHTDHEYYKALIQLKFNISSSDIDKSEEEFKYQWIGKQHLYSILHKKQML
jgi:hypothetical protein